MASPAGDITRDEDMSSDSEELEDDENVAQVEARIATLLTEVYIIGGSRVLLVTIL